jgi:diguanylate cyclase (GGDEF)-like protein
MREGLGAVSVMILLGPCLTLGMSSLALLVVHAGFGRPRHALWWAVGCGLGAAQWGLMAAWGMAGLPALGTGPAVDAFQLLSLVAMVGGFDVRARGRVSPLLPVFGAVAMLAILLLFLVPAPPLRAAVTPLVAAALLTQAATRVPTVPRGISAAEGAVVAVLLAVALIHVAGVLAAGAEAAGLVRDHRAYQAVYLFTTEPACAAAALAALLLIASDFSHQLRRLLHTDPLTGVLNREGFDHAVGRLWERSKNRPLSIAIADIDRFKTINDRFGHGTGDGALAEVAQRLAAGVARDGLVARLGGEEFAILLPGLDGAAALARIEPIRRDLAALRLDGQPALRLSASFGIAHRRGDEAAADLLERADRALYRSKRDGRDRSTLDAAA